MTFKRLGELMKREGSDPDKLKGRSSFEFSGNIGAMGAVYPRPGGLKACRERQRTRDRQPDVGLPHERYHKRR